MQVCSCNVNEIIHIFQNVFLNCIYQNVVSENDHTFRASILFVPSDTDHLQRVMKTFCRYTIIVGWFKEERKGGNYAIML